MAIVSARRLISNLLVNVVDISPKDLEDVREVLTVVVKYQIKILQLSHA